MFMFFRAQNVFAPAAGALPGLTLLGSFQRSPADLL